MTYLYADEMPPDMDECPDCGGPLDRHGQCPECMSEYRGEADYERERDSWIM